MKILLFLAPETARIDIHHQLVDQLAEKLKTRHQVLMGHQPGDEVCHDLNDYDVVHVFGSWSRSAANVLFHAERLNIPSVFTPLGGLQPWVMKKHNRDLAFRQQRHMTHTATAIHLCGKLEKETFEQLGWNHRVVVIKNPVLTSLVSIDEVTVALERLYQKVIDSFARRRLLSLEEQVIGQLIQVGADTTILHNHDYCDQLKSVVLKIDDKAWRRIFIYCQDEQVLNMLCQGLANLRLAVPEIDAEEIERFRLGTKYVQGTLNHETLLSKSVLQKNKLNDLIQENENTERKLTIQLANLKYELEHKQAPLLHLVDVYRSLRFDDVDEVRIAEIFHYFGIEKFASRLMQVEADVLHLTEGFMPLPPTNDKETKRMRREITKFIN